MLELIQRTTEFLKGKDVESPRLQAELLLAHVLKLPRMQLYLNFEKTPTTAQLDEFRQYVRRRGLREPLQHILGSVSFCGRELAVNRQVLVPRPETELLAELGWQYLQGCVKHTEAPRALDYGTGSGCLAIALAANCPQAHVHALDISAEALEVAKRNAAQNQVADRIHFWHGNGFEGLPDGLRFHLLIGNPPYIPSAEIDRLQPEVRDYDPRGALDGGVDGLAHYQRLAVQGAAWLERGGRLMLELGDHQAAPVRALFEAQKWIVERIAEDYTHHPRMMIACKP